MKTVPDIYGQLPAESNIQCKGLCQFACSTIAMTQPEAAYIEEKYALPVLADHPVHGEDMCSALDSAGRCAIYDRRPLICRIWGQTPALECPYGCKPKIEIRANRILKFLEDLRRIGRRMGLPATLYRSGPLESPESIAQMAMKIGLLEEDRGRSFSLNTFPSSRRTHGQ